MKAVAEPEAGGSLRDRHVRDDFHPRPNSLSCPGWSGCEWSGYPCHCQIGFRGMPVKDPVKTCKSKKVKTCPKSAWS